jgi:hypothetical protein
MKKNPLHKKQYILVLHTSGFIRNPMIKRVILINNNTNDINHLLSRYMDGNNDKENIVKQVHLHGEIGDSPDIRGDFQGVVKVFGESKTEIIKHSKMLKERKRYICPKYPVEKREDISFITSMGIAVDLLYQIDRMKEEVILKILDFYLHHPSLTIPIEPFHSILMSKLKRQPLHLWTLYLIFPGLFLHADDTGIAEEPDKLKNKDYLYLIDWENREFKRNESKTEKQDSLKRYFETIPKEHPGCMSCAHFHFCFSWAKYKKDSCDKWTMILDRIQANVKEIEKIREAGKRHKHPDM